MKNTYLSYARYHLSALDGILDAEPDPVALIM